MRFKGKINLPVHDQYTLLTTYPRHVQGLK